jgi:chorismate dehydratase
VTLRIGIVDYLNSWPLAWGFLSGSLSEGFEAVYEPPAAVAEKLASGDLDVGLIPSIEVQRIPGVRVVPGLCVAANHEVRSVILVSARPVGEIRRVALDENSRTSAALVRILLRERYGIEPETTTCAPEIDAMLAAADAALVIGDPALHVDRERFEILDLAAEWRRLTGQPFVFAVWAVREGAPSDGLSEVLHASLGAGLEDMEAIIDRAVGDLGLDPAVAERYLLRHLNYVLGAEEMAGLEEFFLRAASAGAIDTPTPIRFL